MNCEQARQAWHDARDGGALDAGAAAHVADCGECRAYVEQMSAIDGMLDELRFESEGVTARREPRPVRLRRWVPRRRVWLAAAMVAAAVGLAWMTRGLIDGGGGKLVNRDRSGLEDAPPPPDSLAPPGKIDARPVVATRVVLTGQTSDRYLALEAKTSQPGVKVYCLYPMVESGEASGAS